MIAVGGLAVLCRLSRPIGPRPTSTPSHAFQTGQVGQLELLLAAGATLSRPTGVPGQTLLGPVQVDVLEVTDADLAPLPDDPPIVCACLEPRVGCADRDACAPCRRQRGAGDRPGRSTPPWSP